MNTIMLTVTATEYGFDVRENGHLCASFMRLFEARRYAFKRGADYQAIGVPVTMQGVIGR